MNTIKTTFAGAGKHELSEGGRDRRSLKTTGSEQGQKLSEWHRVKKYKIKGHTKVKKVENKIHGKQELLATTNTYHGLVNPASLLDVWGENTTGATKSYHSNL